MGELLPNGLFFGVFSIQVVMQLDRHECLRSCLVGLFKELLIQAVVQATCLILMSE